MPQIWYWTFEIRNKKKPNATSRMTWHVTKMTINKDFTNSLQTKKNTKSQKLASWMKYE